MTDFFDTLPRTLFPSIEIVAVDCVSVTKNRFKVYVRTPSLTFENIRRFMTLGGRLTSRDVTRTLATISAFWKILFPDISDDEEPPLDPRTLRHLTSGLLFYYELRPKRLDPVPKFYMPVRHLCRSDADICRAMEELYLREGNWRAARSYATFFNQVLSVTFFYEIYPTLTEIYILVLTETWTQEPESTRTLHSRPSQITLISRRISNPNATSPETDLLRCFQLQRLTELNLLFPVLVRLSDVNAHRTATYIYVTKSVGPNETNIQDL
jgi:hypothetical protein